MTTYGKIITTIIIILLIALCIITILLSNHYLNTATFTLRAEKNSSLIPSYMLSLNNHPAGKYYVKCVSGYGNIIIANNFYSLKSINTEVTYATKFLNNYYTDGYITINSDQVIVIKNQNNKEDFILEFTFIEK